MSTVDNLKSILVKQKEVLSSLETEIINIETSDLLTENQSLKTELVKCQAFLEKEKSYNLKISEENKKLRNSLYEQLYNEKIKILNTVNSKMDVYYKSNIHGEVNRLTSLETSVKKQIDEIAAVLKANRVGIENEIYKELEELKKLLNVRITLAREEIARQTGAFSENRDKELAKLKQEKVTEEEIKARVNLITQYDLGFNNALISIIYLITALVWITFGFIRRYGFIRRFGLGLSMLSVAKLFIIDLAFLSQGYRIASYFIFGVTLIAISFIYQYFSKRIDNIGR